MKPIPCKFCGEPFLRLPNGVRRKHCFRDACIAKRRAEKGKDMRRRKRAEHPPGVCQFCGRVFVRKKHAGRRQCCYRPECVLKNEAKSKGHQTVYAKAYRERQKAKPAVEEDVNCCNQCGEPLSGNRYFNCKKCADRLSSTFNLDCMYEIVGEA